MLRLQQERQKVDCYRSFAPIEWSEELGCWCVFDPDSLVAIMKSPDFVVVDYAGEYAKLEQRTRIDWSGLVNALNNIPLANEGKLHTKLRGDFAKLITARSALAKSAVEKFAVKAVPFVFRDQRNAELFEELIRPTIDIAFKALIGTQVPHIETEGPSVSQIFDRSLSLNSRKLMQNSVAQLSNALAEEECNLATSVSYATALLIIGHDSLLASLGASLIAVLEASANERLCDITYPDVLPETGVPYVERVAIKDCAIGGLEFHAGDRVRLFLDACPARGTGGDVAPFFGKGRHICLGKDLSLWVWRILVRELARLPVRVSVAQTHIRPKDYVFNLYDRIEVTIHG